MPGVLPTTSIYVFSILLICLPSPVWLITLILISCLCFVVEFCYESAHYLGRLRIRFGQCCALSSTLLLAAKVSLHFLMNINTCIEQGTHFVSERLRVPQLLAVLALGMALIEGRRMYGLYSRLCIEMRNNVKSEALTPCRCPFDEDGL
jgi:hypothetical protein